MMVDNNDHLSIIFLWQRVNCAAKYIDNKLYVVKEKVRNHDEMHCEYRWQKVFADPLIKGLPPSVYREHTVDMGLWYSLYLPDNKGPKVKGSVSE